ncbi:kinase-like protein [Rhizopogon vinicolor AM-OR11-026]|uniref:non-specific serine/threonine protein kinase n=1 Tax=Rhizopogon vinicolor AM-OR11-026 TaxID=1314800 RepID=A0A1B7MPE7_9AGAM|nr:kinase-like protein [Rhizopogon vinicolor AM-OR11-026]
MSSNDSGTANIVGVYFRVGKKIGEGSLGVIFEGTNLLKLTTVAIKFEPRKADDPRLRDEFRSYRTLAGCPGIPQIYHFGQQGLHNILVMDLLGPSLEDLFNMCGRKFSIKTVSMAARQMLSRVQAIHEKSLIYRDIKPDDFLIGCPGTKAANLIHVIDFGMAKHYRDPKTKQHIPYRERKSLNVMARYMSINTHLGRERSRRDDLEALGHVFMYFLRGSLPWQGLKAATNEQRYDKIGEKKMTIPINDLCEGYPEEFGVYLHYVRKLGFEETPDYDFLRELFTRVMRINGDVDDGVFDWNLLNGGEGWETSQGQAQALVQMQNAGLAPAPQDQRKDLERRRDADWRRASQAGGVNPPSQVDAINPFARPRGDGTVEAGDDNPYNNFFGVRFRRLWKASPKPTERAPDGNIGGGDDDTECDKDVDRPRVSSALTFLHYYLTAVHRTTAKAKADKCSLLAQRPFRPMISPLRMTMLTITCRGMLQGKTPLPSMMRRKTKEMRTS